MSEPSPKAWFRSRKFSITRASRSSSPRSVGEDHVIKGRVVKLTATHVVVDVGAKSEGMVPIAEILDHESKPKFQPEIGGGGPRHQRARREADRDPRGRRCRSQVRRHGSDRGNSRSREQAEVPARDRWGRTTSSKGAS